jgi:hypothetical protein
LREDLRNLNPAPQHGGDSVASARSRQVWFYNGKQFCLSEEG